MSERTIAVDLAKNVFEIAVADESNKIVQQKRLSRKQFQRFIENQPASRLPPAWACWTWKPPSPVISACWTWTLRTNAAAKGSPATRCTWAAPPALPWNPPG